MCAIQRLQRCLEKRALQDQLKYNILHFQEGLEIPFLRQVLFFQLTSVPSSSKSHARKLLLEHSAHHVLPEITVPFSRRKVRNSSQVKWKTHHQLWSCWQVGQNWDTCLKDTVFTEAENHSKFRTKRQKNRWQKARLHSCTSVGKFGSTPLSHYGSNRRPNELVSKDHPVSTTLCTQIKINFDS